MIYILTETKVLTLGGGIDVFKTEVFGSRRVMLKRINTLKHYFGLLLNIFFSKFFTPDLLSQGLFIGMQVFFSHFCK